MDELKTKIDLIPLSDETIKHSSHMPCDLWMVQTPNQGALGPFHTQTLKEYAHKYQYLFEEAKVYNLEDDEWRDMFSVSKFQRRKPQLVSAHNLMDEAEIYIIFQGQKNGPHSKEKIHELLDSKQITTTTQISLDKGKSWIKLYEYHAFDRRSKKVNTDLPAEPNKNILEEVPRESLEISQKIQMTDEMLFELSYIKKKKPAKYPTSKAKTKRLEKNLEGTEWQKSSSKAKEGWKYGLSTSLFLLAIVVTFNYTQNNTSDFTTEVPTQARGIDNSARGITKRAPASVKPSKSRKVKRAVRKPVVPRFKATKRRPAARKVTAPRASQRDLQDTFEQDIEKIDINDPDFQQELSRQLANEDDEYYDEENMPNDEPQGSDFLPEDGIEQLPRDVEEQYPADEQFPADEEYPAQEGFESEGDQRDFDQEERFDHEVE